MPFESPSERVFENMVKAFEPRARAIVGFHAIPPQDAEDLVQQTYLTYLRRHEEVRNPHAWLAGTLRQRCLMFWRSRRRSWLSFADSAFLDSRPAKDAGTQERVAMRCDLRKVVRRLPGRSRDLVRLRYGCQFDSRETARRLGYRYSGIYTITKRCLAAMAKELEELGYAEGEDG